MSSNIRLTEEQMHALKRKANIAFAEGQEEIRGINAFYQTVSQQLVPPDEADELTRIKDLIVQAKALCNALYDRMQKRGLVKPRPSQVSPFAHTDDSTIGFTRED